MSVLDEVAAERAAQDAQWGGPSNDDLHRPGVWDDLLEKFMSRASAAWVRREAANRRRGLIQVAALAIAAVEAMDRSQALADAPE
jgi:hypothetical protein